MKKYDSYKNIPEQWLTSIPSEWKTRKLKYCFKERVDKGHPDEPMLCSTQKDGVIPQSMYANRVVVVNKDFEKQKLVKVGDFVISLRSFQGGIEYAYYQGIISAAYTILEPKNNDNSEYFKYLFKSHDFIQLLQTCVTGIREGQNIDYFLLGRKFIPIPPQNEQDRIINYLKDRVSSICSFIAAKQRQVGLLEEYKQAIIAQAVTRGLNPDVKMKPTGYFWLPEIPENWKIKRMKYLFTERSEKNHPDEQMLSATQTYGVIPQSQYGNRVVVVNTGFEGLKLVKVGDFVIHLRSFQGGIEISHAQGIISSAYTILRPIISDDGDYSPYFRFLFKSQNFIDLLKICVTGIREGQNINYAKLKQYFLPIPPIEEQKRIVKYIDTKTSEIDTLLSSIAKEISLLQEYKQRLISDVVTGQINVQNEIV